MVKKRGTKKNIDNTQDIWHAAVAKRDYTTMSLLKMRTVKTEKKSDYSR
jgi:hypothetical protein